MGEGGAAYTTDREGFKADILILLPLGEGGAQRRMWVGWLKRRSRPTAVAPHPFAQERPLRARALKPSPNGRGSIVGVLDRIDPVVVEPEMVADFVDQDVGDDLGQADVAALAPFVEDGAAVEEDA